MKEGLGLNPWLSIWVRPRKTIRALVNFNVNYRLVVLCAIYGFYNMLQISQMFALGQTTSLWMILAFVAVLAIPAGYIAFNISSFFTYYLGKLIKGKASFKQVRAATYWAAVPITVTVLFWIFLMISYGNGVFVPGYEAMVLGTGAQILIVLSFAQVALSAWGLVIYLHALGEVQGFSAWMALLNVFLAGLAIAILLFLLSWGLASLTHVS